MSRLYITLLGILALFHGPNAVMGQSNRPWSIQCARSINLVAYPNNQNNIYSPRKGIELSALYESPFLTSFKFSTGINITCSLFHRIESFTSSDTLAVYSEYSSASYACNIPVVIDYSFNRVIATSFGGFVGYNFRESQTGYEKISSETSLSNGQNFNRRSTNLNPIGIGLISKIRLRMNDRWYLEVAYKHFLSNHYKSLTTIDNAKMRVVSFAIGRSF